MAEDCRSMQLIDGDEIINTAGLDYFMKSVKLSQRVLSYAVVAIMGPQSSGKSTLLNHLFFTNFAMLDSSKGRRQTTKGIWMAKAGSVEPLTIILDIEGNDGQERGEDVTFEKRSALFALALADIVLINMWYNDMGRENGANKPLLKAVFEAMTKLFSPRKTTLLFVIRDTDMRTPVETIESDLRNIIQKIWDNVPKPEHRQNAALEDFFIVKVIALCSFMYQEEQFKDEVAKLRTQFNNSIATGGLAGDGKGRVPGSGFSYSVQNIWKLVQNNKDLDLPAHKVMVATYRCEEIAKETLRHLCEYEGWLALEADAKSGPVPHFGTQLSSILNTHLSKYDKEAMYFDEGVRDAKRPQLESKMLEHMLPAYETLLSHLRSQANERFKTQLEKALSRGEGFAASVRKCNDSCLLEFDKQCKDIAVEQAAHWNPKKVREEFAHDIEAYSSSLRSTKLSEIYAYNEKKLSDAIEGAHIETILIEAGSDSWQSIRELLKSVTKTAELEFISSVDDFELDEFTREEKLQIIRKSARSVVEKKARYEAGKVLTYMKDSFTSAFAHDHDFLPRSWTGEVDIKKFTQDARLASLKILSVLTAIRLEKWKSPDNIENILQSSLMNQSTRNPISKLLSDGASRDPLAFSKWKDVSLADTIITPVQCKAHWKTFLSDTSYIIAHATKIQEANIAKEKAEKAAATAIAELDAILIRVEAARKEERAEVDAILARVEAATKEERVEADARVEREVQRAIAAADAARDEAAAAAERAEAALEAARRELAARAEGYFTKFANTVITLCTSIGNAFN